MASSGVDFSRAFHIGVRVGDLERAMKELGPSLDVSWSRVQEREQAIWTPAAGALLTPLRFTYSTAGPLHIELLQGEPGTIWDAGDGLGVHHTGVWADDVGAETHRLMQAGWSLIGANCSPEDGIGRYSYLLAPAGIVIELVASALSPMFERWWAGGDLR